MATYRIQGLQNVTRPGFCPITNSSSSNATPISSRVETVNLDSLIARDDLSAGEKMKLMNAGRLGEWRAAVKARATATRAAAAASAAKQRVDNLAAQRRAAQQAEYDRLKAEAIEKEKVRVKRVSAAYNNCPSTPSKPCPVSSTPKKGRVGITTQSVTHVPRGSMPTGSCVSTPCGCGSNPARTTPAPTPKPPAIVTRTPAPSKPCPAATCPASCPGSMPVITGSDNCTLEGFTCGGPPDPAGGRLNKGVAEFSPQPVNVYQTTNTQEKGNDLWWIIPVGLIIINSMG